MFSKFKQIPPRHLAAAGFFLLLVAYGVYQTRSLLLGPKIEIDAPLNGAALAMNPVEIKGQAERIAFLSLNGGRIFTDESGNFNQKLLLAPGYNIISLEAQDKFGRTVKKVLHLVYN